MARPGVGEAGHHDHAAAGLVREGGGQEVGQQEAAEVVHLHHRLLPVLSHLAGGQEGHASVVHQNVNFRLLQ